MMIMLVLQVMILVLLGTGQPHRHGNTVLVSLPQPHVWELLVGSTLERNNRYKNPTCILLYWHTYYCSIECGTMHMLPKSVLLTTVWMFSWHLLSDQLHLLWQCHHISPLYVKHYFTFKLNTILIHRPHMKLWGSNFHACTYIHVSCRS